MLLKKIEKHFLCLVLYSMLLTACGSFSSDNSMNVNYLAVQVEDGGNWSIISADGKLIADEEYAPECEISRIYNEGVYWVKTNGKYALYSLKSPKKPLIKGEYDEVTDFENGLAFVMKVGEQIQMINDRGKIVKTLPKDVLCAYKFTDNMALYDWKNSDNGDIWSGYLNEKGEVAIDPKYKQSSFFHEGLAWVKKDIDHSCNAVIIDKNGDELFELNGNEFDLHPYLNYFQESKISAAKGSSSLVFLNKKGEEVITIPNAYYSSTFIDDYAVVFTNEFNPYIIDSKGDEIVRKGKYKNIDNLGGGYFLVKKGSKYGVIDKDDNIVVDFNYTGGSEAKLGDNFVMIKEGYAVLVKPNGEEIKDIKFVNASSESFNSVTFVDIKTILNDFFTPITANGYATIMGKTKATEIGPITGAKLEHYLYELPGKSFKANGIDVSVTYGFNAFATKDNIRVEEVNDGWFASKKQVRDGFTWNEKAEIFNIDQTITIANFKNEVALHKLLKELLEAKNFVLESEEYKKMKFSTSKGDKLFVEYYCYDVSLETTIKTRLYPSNK